MKFFQFLSSIGDLQSVVVIVVTVVAPYSESAAKRDCKLVAVQVTLFTSENW